MTMTRQSKPQQRRRDFTLTDDERAKIAAAQAAGRRDPWAKRDGEGEEAKRDQGART